MPWTWVERVGSKQLEIDKSLDGLRKKEQAQAPSPKKGNGKGKIDLLAKLGVLHKPARTFGLPDRRASRGENPFRETTPEEGETNPFRRGGFPAGVSNLPEINIIPSEQGASERVTPLAFATNKLEVQAGGKLYLDTKARQKAIEAGENFYNSIIYGGKVSVVGFPLTRTSSTGEIEAVNPDTGFFPGEGKPEEYDYMAAMRERFANDPNPIIRFANTPTRLLGFTPADIVGIGLIIQEGISAIRSFTEFRRLPQVRAMEAVAKERNIPRDSPAYQDAQNALKTAFNLHKMGATEAADEIIGQFNKAYAGRTGTPSAVFEMTKAIAPFNPKLAPSFTPGGSAIPGQTRPLADIMAGAKAELVPKVPALTKALWDATPVAQRVINAQAAGLSGQVSSKAFEVLTSAERTALEKITAPVTPAKPEVTEIEIMKDGLAKLLAAKPTDPESVATYRKIIDKWSPEYIKENYDIYVKYGAIKPVTPEVTAGIIPTKPTFRTRVWNVKNEPIDIPVQGRRVVIPGFEELDLFIHKEAFLSAGEPKFSNRYHISEVTTGLKVTPEASSTQREAIAKVTETLNKKGIETVRKAVGDAEKLKPALAEPVTPAPEVRKEPWQMTAKEWENTFITTMEGHIGAFASTTPLFGETVIIRGMRNRKGGRTFYTMNFGKLGQHYSSPEKAMEAARQISIKEQTQKLAIPKEPVTTQPPVPTAPEQVVRAEPVAEAITETNPLAMTSTEFNARYPRPRDLPAEKQQSLLDMLNETNLEETGVDEPLSLATFIQDMGDMRFDLETGGAFTEEHQQMIEAAAKRGDEIAPKVRAEYQDIIGKIEQKKATARVLREKKRQARAKPLLQPTETGGGVVPPSPPPVPIEAGGEGGLRPPLTTLPPEPLPAVTAERQAQKVAPAEAGVPPIEPPVKPEAPKTPVQRREEIKTLLAEPAKNLPKGTTKIALRKELGELNKSLVPQEKKLRQQIMASVKSKSLPEKQYRAIFKDTGGSRQLSTIGLPKLEAVFKAIQRARPRTIGGKKVASPEIEQQIQDTKQNLNVSDRDYDAIKRLFNIRNDKFVDSKNFITQYDATRLIKAMKRKSLIGFANIEEAVKSLVFSMGPPSKTPTPITQASFDVPWSRRLADKANSFLMRTYRVERLLDKLDGKDNGPLWTAFYKTLNEATSNKVRGYYGKMEEFRGFITENNINLFKLMSDRVEIQPGLSLSPSEKIGVYLSSLNKDNLRHLKEGNRFTDEIIETVKSSLSEQERQVADWLKTYFENEHSAISEAKLYVTDEPLDKVENYFPIRLQWKSNPALDYWEQIAREDSYRFATDWASAGIPKGFTKERTGEAIQAVDLDALFIFLNHLEAVEHYKAFAPAIADLQIILKNNAFKSAFINKAGRSAYQVVDRWLKQTAEVNPLRPANQAEALIRTMRVNATTAVLGLNITTALKQFPSFVSGAAEAGIVPSLNGLFTFLHHPIETRQLIKQFSPQIYTRTFEREIAEAQRMRGTGKILAGKLGARQVFMFLTTTMDQTAVSALWRGSFEDGISKGLSPEQAAAKAEEVIRKTQPFFDVKDLPEYYRSGEFMKALTIFTNQLNNYWNYYNFDVAGKYKAGRIGKWEVLRRVMLAFVIPALMIGAISRSRPAKSVKEFAFDLVSMGVATIPLAGSWITSGIKGFTDTSLITTELADEIAIISNKVTNGKWETMWQEILSLGGYVAGIPVAQPKRTIKAMAALATEETDDWLELIWGKYARKEAEVPLYSPAPSPAKSWTPSKRGLPRRGLPPRRTLPRRKLPR